MCDRFCFFGGYIGGMFLVFMRCCGDFCFFYGYVFFYNNFLREVI